ncbi:Farnesyl pyrophosphate synthase [Orchesella cincta]|uniref:Farnesyl pyrophosphate synthase n=1 Tax=Orchesella cincta TaxID=48709 RepID=A0A1D2M435_ORCCI|nr:Farnesyl pyrophosphate synthase [Orchesella cincta]
MTLKKSSTPVGIFVAPPLPIFTPVRSAQVTRKTMERQQLLTEVEREDFLFVYHTIVKDLLDIPGMEDMEETNLWMEKMLHYNVTHGKQIRGQVTAMAYKHFALGKLTDENIRLSYILGWCTEILNACLVVADDIMDESEIRRGRQCWYKFNNLGLPAINDAMLLNKYFKHKTYYTKTTAVMINITYRTLFGQSLDTRTSQERRLETLGLNLNELVNVGEFRRFTMETYTAIVKNKTSLYTYYLPFALAMTMAEIKDPTLFQEVRNVAVLMGHFLQVRDDFLDCFGDVELTGKIGTDIQNCKCSWLYLVAMQSCSSGQKSLLIENYGQYETEKISAVKNLYNELKLEDVYHKYEEQAYNQICTQIQQLSDGLPKGVFFRMLHAYSLHRSIKHICLE